VKFRQLNLAHISTTYANICENLMCRSYFITRFQLHVKKQVFVTTLTKRSVIYNEAIQYSKIVGNFVPSVLRDLTGYALQCQTKITQKARQN